VYSVTGDVDNAMMAVSTPTLDQSVIGVKTDFITAIDRVTGLTSQYLGVIGTSGNTAEGSRIAVERAKVVEEDALHNIKEFVESIVNIMVQHIITHYSGENLISGSIDPSAKRVTWKSAQLPTRKDMEGFNYTFYIDLTQKNRYKLEEEKQKLLEIYQLQEQYASKDPDSVKLVTQLDLIRQMDVKNLEDYEERFERLSKEAVQERVKLITEIVSTTSAMDFGHPDVLQDALTYLIRGTGDPSALEAVQMWMQQAKQENNANKAEAVAQYQQMTGADPAQLAMQLANSKGAGLTEQDMSAGLTQGQEQPYNMGGGQQTLANPQDPFAGLMQGQ